MADTSAIDSTRRSTIRSRIGWFALAGFLLGGCTPPGASSTPAASIGSAPSSSAPATAGAVQPTVEPEPTLSNCPTEPMTPIEFSEAPRRCFGGDDVMVHGWLDEPPIFGFLPPEIRPNWLAYPPDGTGFFTLFMTPPTDPEPICDGCIFLHLPPDSAIALGGPARWVIATGHRRDPAAATCFYHEPDDWTGPEPDDAGARETCRSSFVLTALEDAPPP